MQATTQTSGELRKNKAILVAATFGSGLGISSLPFYSLGSFITPLEMEFGWSRSDISSSYLYSTIAIALTAPLLGKIIDHIGTKPVALVSIPLFALVLYLLSHFDGTISQFHALYALAAIAGAGTSPINYTRAVNESFKNSRGFALGISQSGIALAAISLPLLLANLNDQFSWRTGYLTLSALALIPWPLVLFGMKNNRRRLPKIEQPTIKRSGTSFFKTWIFWGIGVSFSAIAIGVSSLVVHMIPLLRDAGVSAMEAASIASIIGFGVLGGRLVTGWLIDRYFAPYVAATLFLLSAFGCMILVYGGASMAPVAAALVGFSLGAEADLIAYFTARYFGLEQYAFVYGFIYSMFVIGTATGPALAGTLYDISGNYNSTILAATFLLIFGSLIILRFPRFEKASH